MNNEPRFRILERAGQVHIQEQNSFLGLRWWSTIKIHYIDSGVRAADYGSVAEAKVAIDRALAVYRLENKPEVITCYPS